MTKFNDIKLYQLSFLDMKTGVRKRYMNGIGFKTITEARKEFVRIKKEAKVAGKFHNDIRSEWNIEIIERRIVDNLFWN